MIFLIQPENFCQELYTWLSFLKIILKLFYFLARKVENIVFDRNIQNLILFQEKNINYQLSFYFNATMTWDSTMIRVSPFSGT